MKHVDFDYSQGQAFVQGGVLYYSPNCSRPVVIPREDSLRFTGSDFDTFQLKQPVWWSSLHFGWRSFIPLLPTFTSLPFEQLCWMPKINEQDRRVGPRGFEKQYIMSSKAVESWMRIEDQLQKAAKALRKEFCQGATPPPLPSNFGFCYAFSSLEAAKKAIITSRNWFTIWMGYLSFLIAHTMSSYDPDSPLPRWYQELLGLHESYGRFSRPWLDALALSDVCSFDAQTPRAGVFFRWFYDDPTRPDIAWFHAHHIPLFFCWSRYEEDKIASDKRYDFLRPPAHLLQEALSFLWKTPDMPLAALLVRRFYHIEEKTPLNIGKIRLLNLQSASSYVLKATTTAFLDQYDRLMQNSFITEKDLQKIISDREAEAQRSAEEAAAAFPSQSMLDMDEEDRGTLFKHFREFFALRETRQAEILKVESTIERQRRESREKNPPTKKTRMFEWTRIMTGGRTLHMRVLLPRSKHEYFHSELEEDRKRYNAMANEWDVFSEFAPSAPDSIATDYDALFADRRSPEYYTPGSPYQSAAVDGDMPHDGSPVDQIVGGDLPTHDNSWQGTATNDIPTRHDDGWEDPSAVADGGIPTHKDDRQLEDNTNSFMECISSDSTPDEEPSNIFEHLQLSYGCANPLGLQLDTNDTNSCLDWRGVLNTLGLVNDPAKFLSESDMRAIRVFISRLSSPSWNNLPQDLDTLNPSNHLSIRDLFEFRDVRRPVENLFTFDTPPSSACSWLLGVNHATAALYICRYILTNPMAHTILTVAHHLLKRGIPFRTLLLLPATDDFKPLYAKTKPLSYRKLGYCYTQEDFDGSMLACKDLLNSPHGRAALLRGGIIARIARQFLSLEVALDGPSVEAAERRTGFMSASHMRGYEYWDDDLSDREIGIICGLSVLWTGHGDQTVTLSWFPPPQVWDSDRSGFRWLEWTERDETFFRSILLDIRSGKHQPLRNTQWLDKLRGFRRVRSLVVNNEKRSKDFMNIVCPFV